MTNGQMAEMMTHIKSQEDKVNQLNDLLSRLDASAGEQTKKVDDGFDKLNSDLTAKIGNLRGELNNQKAVWDSAIDEQGKAAVKTRELLNTYKTENEDLKDQIKALKEKVDTVVNIPTP